MHYDGTGTGDNGSGVALGLTTAEKFFDVETQFTIKFVFFTAEEYGLYGSTAYAESMTDEEKANTLYMINIDSIVCGDYCYIYGGVQDNANKTVTKTEAYDNASAVAKSLGLEFKLRRRKPRLCGAFHGELERPCAVCGSGRNVSVSGSDELGNSRLHGVRGKLDCGDADEYRERLS